MRRLRSPIILTSLFTTLTLASPFVIGALFWGCSGKDINDSDPAALFKDAEEDVKNDHYQIAIDKFHTLKNKFPYSNYAVEAQLRLADVYFLQESWPEAAANYETFRELHPKHEKVPYAMFRTGKSYFNDIPSTVARDLTSANKSLTAYNEFLKRFPAAGESEEARKDVAQIRKTLSEKELYVGNFYYKRGFYDSAKPRFKKVVDQFPDTVAAKEAQTKITKIEEQKKKNDDLSE